MHCNSDDLVYFRHFAWGCTKLRYVLGASRVIHQPAVIRPVYLEKRHDEVDVERRVALTKML